VAARAPGNSRTYSRASPRPPTTTSRQPPVTPTQPTHGHLNTHGNAGEGGAQQGRRDGGERERGDSKRQRAGRRRAAARTRATGSTVDAIAGDEKMCAL
jgi:hypothetical protein